MFGRKLKILRFNLDLNQQEMAEKLHISQAVYCRYENDKKEFSIEFIQRVDEIFGLDFAGGGGDLNIGKEKNDSQTKIKEKEIYSNQEFYMLPKELIDKLALLLEKFANKI